MAGANKFKKHSPAVATFFNKSETFAKTKAKTADFTTFWVKRTNENRSSVHVHFPYILIQYNLNINPTLLSSLSQLCLSMIISVFYVPGSKYLDEISSS